MSLDISLERMVYYLRFWVVSLLCHRMGIGARFSRLLPWALAVAFFAALIATHSELERWRGKFNYMDAWVYAAHAAVSENSLVVLGDSITANAQFPDRICGHPVVKAGYGGAGTNDFIVLSRTILEGRRPWMVVVALGANDASAPNLAHDYRALLIQIAPNTDNVAAVSSTADPRVLAVQREVAASLGVPFHEIQVTGLMPDRIHFNADGYRQWIPAIAGAICRD
jgi:lysophospholipase L1-like esterase